MIIATCGSQRPQDVGQLLARKVLQLIVERLTFQRDIFLCQGHFDEEIGRASHLKQA